jgi:hypothetical protein
MADIVKFNGGRVSYRVKPDGSETFYALNITYLDAILSGSGEFENVTFNIPNPEVVESFEGSLPFAEKSHADILISSDPDADRIGVMANHNGEFRFLTGNEIGMLLTQ